MAWTVDYTDTAKDMLRKLDKNIRQDILDYMEQHIAGYNKPRDIGKELTGPSGDLWRYRICDYHVVCEIQSENFKVLVLRIAKPRHK